MLIVRRGRNISRAACLPTYSLDMMTCHSLILRASPSCSASAASILATSACTSACERCTSRALMATGSSSALAWVRARVGLWVGVVEVRGECFG